MGEKNLKEQNVNKLFFAMVMVLTYAIAEEIFLEKKYEIGSAVFLVF